jgi:hypothetical protein
MFTLEDVDELLEGVDELGEELELLDEHAASSSVAPTATSPYATRVARGFLLPPGFGLPSRKLFMRPRISHPGSDQTTTLIIHRRAAPGHITPANA